MSLQPRSRLRFLLEVAGIVLVIAAAVAVMVLDVEQITVATYLALALVSACFAASYLGIYRFVMPRLLERVSSWPASFLLHSLAVLTATGLGAESAARLIGGDNVAENRWRFFPVGLAILVIVRLFQRGEDRLRARAEGLAEELELARSPLTGEPSPDHDPATEPAPAPRITARRGSTEFVFEPGQISRLRAEHKYVAFDFEGRRYLTDESLNHLETRLSELGFLRVHRSELIQVSRVRALDRRDRGGVVAILDDGQRVPVSRRRAGQLRRWLGIGDP